MIISHFVKVPEANITQAQLDGMKGFRLKDFFEVKAVPISIIAAIMGFSYSSILSFISSYAIDIHLESAASFFFIVYAVFILISRPFTGRLMDLKGDNIVVFPAMVCFVIGLLAISQAHSSFVFLLAGALIGLGYGTLTSSTQAIAVKESPHYRVALATSTFFIFVDGGVGIGPFVLGALIPIFKFRGLYVMLAGLVLFGILLYYLLHGKKQKLRNPLSEAVSEN
jgi:MFS family permease